MNVKSLIKRCFPSLGLDYRHVAFPIFRSNVYSQNGEDGVLEFMIKKLPTLPRFVVDIGANDGIEASNSRLLIKRYGFKGILIEPYPPAYAKLKELYKNHLDVMVCDQAVGSSTQEHGTINWHGHFQGLTTPIRNVNDLLETSSVPIDIGVLSIDIDGGDNEVLQSLDWKRFSPWIVIAEIDSSKPSHLQTQTAIMDQAGYHPVLHIGNVFYLRKDKAGEFFFNWKTPFSGVFGVFQNHL